MILRSVSTYHMPLSKKEIRPFNVELNSGYEYMQQSPPSINAVDQKETMQITARRGCMDDLWPSKPENFRSTIEHMMELTYDLACNILSLLEANACPHLQPGTLVKAHNLNDDGGQCMFRLIHYPPTSGDIIEEDNGLWRCGPHTDWGCLTLLFQRMGEEGLECRVNNNIQEGGDDNAKWIEVKPIEYIGDMLKRWSDSKLVSNMHRVRMPRIADDAKNRGTQLHSSYKPISQR